MKAMRLRKDGEHWAKHLTDHSAEYIKKRLFQHALAVQQAELLRSNQRATRARPEASATHTTTTGSNPSRESKTKAVSTLEGSGSGSGSKGKDGSGSGSKGKDKKEPAVVTDVQPLVAVTNVTAAEKGPPRPPPVDVEVASLASR